MVTKAPPSRTTLAKSGDRTREHLLEAAGEVFAAKGHDRATSREICDLAGANSAAVNYHFGGIEALYAATLAHAHRRVFEVETLNAIALSDLDAKAKLRAVLTPMVRLLLEPASWEIRLLGREIASPTPAKDRLIETEILPKIQLIRAVIAEVIGCPANDPLVGRAILTTTSPLMLLALTDRAVIERILPSLTDPEAEAEPLVAHFERFILAGLEAVANGRRDGATADATEGKRLG